MNAPLVIAAEPVSIPLSSQDAGVREVNEAKLLHFTGRTVNEIKALADTKGLPLRRSGKGSGTRYELYLRDYRQWLEKLPQD